MGPCRTRWAFIALLMLTGTLTVLEGYLLRAPATVNSRTPITIHLPASHSNERFISNRFKTTLSRGNARHCSSNDSTNEDASTSEHIPAVEDPNLHIDSVLRAEVEDIVSIFLSQDASINKETKNRVADVLEISKGAAEEIEKAHKMTVAPHLEMEEGRRQTEGRQQHRPGEGAAAAAAAAPGNGEVSISPSPAPAAASAAAAGGDSCWRRRYVWNSCSPMSTVLPIRSCTCFVEDRCWTCSSWICVCSSPTHFRKLSKNCCASSGSFSSTANSRSAKMSSTAAAVRSIFRSSAAFSRICSRHRTAPWRSVAARRGLSR
mmetsp:Transcript_28532/g.46955  ORF Transcript_28532/g.46955 Transcript_28532/m.46955 type:complete len:319 (+) Transcript_28532:53-1009(+)